MRAKTLEEIHYKLIGFPHYERIKFRVRDVVSLNDYLISNGRQFNLDRFMMQQLPFNKHIFFLLSSPAEVVGLTEKSHEAAIELLAELYSLPAENNAVPSKNLHATQITRF